MEQRAQQWMGSLIHTQHALEAIISGVAAGDSKGGLAQGEEAEAAALVRAVCAAQEDVGRALAQLNADHTLALVSSEGWEEEGDARLERVLQANEGEVRRLEARCAQLDSVAHMRTTALVCAQQVAVVQALAKRGALCLPCAFVCG